ncbi:MAG: DegT/DnrJ/EryC1/StrS family aminotransferase, partial [Pseudomonadota bacterium]
GDMACERRRVPRGNPIARHVSRIPAVIEGGSSTWAQYTIEVPDPAAFAVALKAEDIPTARYYPRPTHRQTAYEACPLAGNGLPVTDACAETVISLPIHAYLDEATQDMIIDAAIQAVRNAARTAA